MSGKRSNEDESLLGFIQRIPGQISSVIAFFTLVAGAVVSLTNWLGGNTITAVYVILTAFLLIFWEITLYICFRKADVRSYTARQGRQVHKKHIFSKKTRLLALATAVITTGLCATGALYWRRVRSLPADKTIILVADFQSLDGQNYGVTEKIIEQLRDAVKSFPGIEIQGLKQSIAAQDDSATARTIANEKKAAILLWGFYRKTQESVWLTTHIEILQKPRNLRLKRDKQELTLPVKGIESFQIQTQLSQEISYLILLTLGLGHYEADDPSNAVDLFTRALSQNAVPEQMVNPADIYFFRGNAYLSMSDYDKAIADYNESLRLSPENFCTLCAYSNLGNAYIFKMKYDEAVASLNHALKYSRGSDDNARLHYALGITYEGKNDYDRALAEYSESINQEASADAYERLGVRYHMKAEFDKALTAYNEALKLNPEHAWAYNNRGITYSIIGKYDKAISDYDQALNYDPDNSAIIYNNRGNAHVDKGDYSDALADFNASVQIDPTFSGAYYSRGYLYLQQRMYEKAIEDFNRALSLQNDYTEVYHHRGIAFQMLGYKDKAISDYRKFLELASNEDDSSRRYAHDNSRRDVIERLTLLTH